METYELIQTGNDFQFPTGRLVLQQYTSDVPIHINYDGSFEEYIISWRYSLTVGMDETHPLEYHHSDKTLILPYSMLKELTKNKVVFFQGKAVKGERTVQTNVIKIKIKESLLDGQIVDPGDPSDIMLITDIVDQKFKADILPHVDEITKDAKQYRDDAKQSADQAETTLNEVVETADQKVSEIVSTASNETQKACTAIEAYKDDKKAELQSSVDAWQSDIDTQGNTIIQDANSVLNETLQQVENARRSASAASESANQANDAKQMSIEKANEANTSASNASTYESDALISRNASQISETNAKTSETNATKKASDASTSATQAAQSATNASGSEARAKTSETNSKASENTAKTYSDQIKNSAEKIASNELAVLQAQLTADAGVIGNKNNEELITIIDNDVEELKKRELKHAKIGEAEGRMITISDGDDFFLDDLQMFGETHQDTTTGKNMISNNNIIIVSGKNYVCSNANYQTKGTIEILENKQYIFSYKTEVPSNQKDWNIFCFGENGEKMNFLEVIQAEDTRKFTTPIGASKMSYYAKITTNGTANVEKAKVMLNEGYEIIPYEPYTGGVSSPNPDYPQELISETVKEIVVRGSNLLDPELYKSTIHRGITYTKNNDGSIGAVGTVMDSSSFFLGEYINRLVDGETYYFISGTPYGVFRIESDIVKYDKTVTVNKKTMKSIQPYLQWAVGETVNKVLFPMLNKGATALPREPYKERKIVLSQPIELRGIPVSSGGNVTIDGQQYVSDSIECIDGKICHVKRVKSFIFDGSVDENWIIGDAGENKKRTMIGIGKDVKINDTLNGIRSLNSNFKPGTTGGTWSFDECYTINQGDENVEAFLYCRRDGNDTIETFRAYLQEKPMTLIAMLKEPVIAFLPLADQIKIKSLRTFKGISNLTDDADTYKKIHYMIEFDQITYMKQKSFDLAMIAKKEGYMISIDDSAGYYNKSFSAYGETGQFTTTGAQLFDASKLISRSQYGATITNNGNGSFTIIGSGNITSNFTHTFTYSHEESLKLLKKGSLTLITEKTTLPYIYFVICIKPDGKETALTEINNMYSIKSAKEIKEEWLQDETLYVRFGFYAVAGATIQGGTIKPMVYQDGDGTWEPFTGAKPSPNPDYQQELISKTVKEIVVRGSNLFDVSKAQDNRYQNYDINNNNFSIWSNSSYWVTGLIQVVEGETYTTDGKHIGGCFYSDENTPIRSSVINGGISKLTIPKGAKFINLSFAKAAISFGTIITINKGTTALPWEPYKERKIVLSQPITLRGIPVASGGNVTIDGQQYVSDSIEVVDGKMFHVKRIGIVDNAKWNYANVMAGTAGKRYNYVASDIEKKRYTKVMCTHYTQRNIASYEIKGDYISTDEAIDNRLLIRTLDTQFETVQDFINWTTSTNMETNYILETPILEQLPEKDQKAFKEFQLFQGCSNITADGAWVQLEYVVDQNINNNNINKRLLALEKEAVYAI